MKKLIFILSIALLFGCSSVFAITVIPQRDGAATVIFSTNEITALTKQPSQYDYSVTTRYQKAGNRSPIPLYDIKCGNTKLESNLGDGYGRIDYSSIIDQAKTATNNYVSCVKNQNKILRSKISSFPAKPKGTSITLNNLNKSQISYLKSLKTCSVKNFTHFCDVPEQIKKFLKR